MSATQTSLLALLDTVQAVPRSASGDPVASEKAETRMRKSGRMKAQALECLAMVKANPGRTSKQLGSIAPDTAPWLDRYVFARRLPELESAGLVRRTDEDVESRWWTV